MVNVLSSENEVVSTDDEQVEWHEEVGQRQVLDVERVHLVGLYRQEKPADEDDDVAETGDECNQPHADSENNAVEKMGYAADTVPSRIADAHMKCQGTHVEIVEIAVK